MEHQDLITTDGGHADVHAKGNVGQAARIFAEYGDFIWKVICSSARNDHVADDLYQSFFVLLVARQIPNSVENMRKYLYRMLANHIANLGREIQKHNNFFKKYAAESDFPIRKSPSISVIYTGEPLQEVLMLARKRLTPKEYTVVYMKYVEGYDSKTIAETMGVKEASVSRYINAAIAKLRRAVSTEADEL